MKTNLLKYYIAAFYLCSTFVMIAQPGTESDDTSEVGLEGVDAPAAPIDAYAWVLAAIGLVYVFHRLRTFALQEKSSEE
jgi:hypothetical protein